MLVVEVKYFVLCKDNDERETIPTDNKFSKDIVDF